MATVQGKFGYPGVYNSAGRTVGDGDAAALSIDSTGALIISATSGSGAILIDDAAFTVGTSPVMPVAGTYRSSRDSVDNNDIGALAMTIKRGLYTSLETPLGDSAMDDTNDAVKVVNATAGNLNMVAFGWDGASNVAMTVIADDSNMPATPSNVPVGGEYRNAATTYTDGDSTVLQTDVNGYLRVHEMYSPGYEDNTNNKAIVEHRYSYQSVVAADTQVKSSAGFLHTVTLSCNDAAPTAGSLIIYDNTAESGTQVFNHTFTTTPFAPLTLLLDYTMSTGIYFGFTTTADVNVSASYR